MWHVNDATTWCVLVSLQELHKVVADEKTKLSLHELRSTPTLPGEHGAAYVAKPLGLADGLVSEFAIVVDIRAVSPT